MATASVTSGDHPRRDAALAPPDAGLGALATTIVVCLAAGWPWSRSFAGGVAFEVIGCTALAAGIGWVGARQRWPSAAVGLASCVIFVVIAAWTAFGRPTAVVDVARAVPVMVRRTLDLPLPLDRSGPPVVLAEAACWVVAALAIELLERRRSRLGALVPPVAGFAVAVAMGSPDGGSGALSVCAMAASAGAFLAVTASVKGGLPAGQPGGRGVLAAARRPALGVLAAAVCGVLGATGPWISGTGRDLHRSVPFDPRELPSPLTIVQSDLAVSPPAPRFELTDLNGAAVDRISLATADRYDGVDWLVRTRFRTVGGHAPDDPRGAAIEPVAVRLRSTGYEDIWVPHVGDTSEVIFGDATPRPDAVLVADPDRSSIARSPRIARGSIVTARGTQLRTRDREVVGAEPVDDLGPYLQLPQQLSAPPAASAGDGGVSAQCRLDEILRLGRSWAAEAAPKGPGAARARAQLVAIETRFREQFSVDPAFGPGVSVRDLCHALDVGPERIERTDGRLGAARSEQFATAMALMARSLGIPSRLVVGYVAPLSGEGRTREVTSADARAWVQAYLTGQGWVTFDPTPSAAGTASDQRPKISPRRPTPPPLVSTTLPSGELPTTTIAPTVDDPAGTEQVAAGGGAWSLPKRAGATSALLLVVLVGPAAFVIRLKALRRTRRRAAPDPNARVVGAWQEAVDRFIDERVEIRPSQTAREVGETAFSAMERVDIEPLVRRLGDLSSEARYSKVVVDEDRVDTAWTLLADLEAAIDDGRGRGPARRLVARARLRSLLRRTEW
jgi:transglutaminase-like putative cysteine protease